MDVIAPANPLDRVALIARDIKLSHTVFALPFALLAMMLAAGSAGRLPSAVEIILIVVCMFFARTVAMCMNRFADRAIDADNPRTAKRAVPSGQLPARWMLGSAAVCSALFMISCAGFWVARGNPWPLLLSPLVLAYLVGYSYTKRITALCHVYLGSALAISPLAAVIAIEPGYLAAPEVYMLAGVVMTWVAGFDVIYALQDVATDRAKGLFSMPARLGSANALWIARGLHLMTIGALFSLLWISPQLSLLFGMAVTATAGLLVLEHALVWRSETNRIHMAFFTVNGIISLLLGAAGIADILLALRA